MWSSVLSRRPGCAGQAGLRGRKADRPALLVPVPDRRPEHVILPVHGSQDVLGAWLLGERLLDHQQRIELVRAKRGDEDRGVDLRRSSSLFGCVTTSTMVMPEDQVNRHLGAASHLLTILATTSQITQTNTPNERRPITTTSSRTPPGLSL